MNEHTVKAFTEELDQLSSDIARMGGLTEAMLADAIKAVAQRDSALAKEVRQRDRQVNAMRRELEQKVIRLVALRQPMAGDLRNTIAALKISTDLERIGDLAKNIAKRTMVINKSNPVQFTRHIERMADLVGEALREVLDAYSTSDIERAIAVWRRDEDIDEHYNSLFRELLTYMMEDPRNIGACAHLLFVAKNLERIGDHATNIAEDIHYLVTGEELWVDLSAPDESGPAKT